jgi:hypothetical protein
MKTNIFCSLVCSKPAGMVDYRATVQKPYNPPLNGSEAVKQTGGGLSVSYNPFMFIEFPVFTLFIDGAKDVGF